MPSGGDVWVIGAVLNLCGSVGINFGTNLMKLHHVKNDRREKSADGRRKRERHSRTWLFGFAVFALGNLFNFVSMGFAAQSLLAALGSIQFVSNVAFQWLFLKQAITQLLVAATSLIVVGNVLIVLFSSHEDTQFTSSELMHLYVEQTYLTYMAVLAVVLVLCQLLYTELNKRAREPAFRQTLWIMKLLPLSYALVSAIVGTQSVTLAKSSSVLLRRTFTGENQFAYFFTYVILGAWGGTMVFWMRRLNSALRKYDGLLIVPVLQVCWTFFSILGGGIYFQEFNAFSTTQTVLFALGVLVVFSGIYLLSTAVVVEAGGGAAILIDEGELEKPDMAILDMGDDDEHEREHERGKDSSICGVNDDDKRAHARSDGSASPISVIVDVDADASPSAARVEVSTDREGEEESGGSGGGVDEMGHVPLKANDDDEEEEEEGGGGGGEPSRRTGLLTSPISPSRSRHKSGDEVDEVEEAEEKATSPREDETARDDVADGHGHEVSVDGDGGQDEDDEDDDDEPEVFFQHSPFLQAVAAVGGALPLIESGTRTPVRRSSQTAGGRRSATPSRLRRHLQLPSFSLGGGKDASAGGGAGAGGAARGDEEHSVSVEPRTAPIRRPPSHARLLDALRSDSPSEASSSVGQQLLSPPEQRRRNSTPSSGAARRSRTPSPRRVTRNEEEEEEEEEEARMVASSSLRMLGSHVRLLMDDDDDDEEEEEEDGEAAVEDPSSARRTASQAHLLDALRSDSPSGSSREGDEEEEGENRQPSRRMRREGVKSG